MDQGPGRRESSSPYAEPVEIVSLQNDCGETGFVVNREKKKKKQVND
jgi:hypothetical protein